MKKGWIHLIVQHGKFAPLRCEEYFAGIHPPVAISCQGPNI